MVEGRDSAYAPSDAQLAQFHAQGVRVYGGYIKLGNDGVLNGWTQGDFARVRAAGMTPIAFFSGFDDPATVKTLAALWGVRACLDDESGMRPDGTWVQSELDASGGGLYGNAQYQNRTAVFHVLAAYPTSGDPGGEPWPTWLARPSTPCGWQWAGSHVENGITVDSAWYDDSFAPAFSGASGSLTAANQSPPRRATAIAISSDAINLFGRGTDNALWHLRWSADKGWTTWTSLGGILATPDIVVTQRGAWIDVFVMGLSGADHIYSMDNGATWSGYETHGGAFTGPLAAVASTATPGSPSVDLSPVESAIAAVKAELDTLKPASAIDLTPLATAVAAVQASVTAVKTKTDKDLA